MDVAVEKEKDSLRERSQAVPEEGGPREVSDANPQQIP